MTWRFRLLILLSLALLLSGCAMTMKEQPKYEPLALSDFYPDGKSALYAPTDTVARGIAQNKNPVLVTGQVGGTPVPDFPFQLTIDDLKRGQGLFNDTCAPCHDRTGSGNGVIVERGFPKPPALTAANIVAMPAGQLFGVITNGFGAMPSYGHILQPTDRWRVVGYLRALQLSQNGTLQDVPPQQQNQIKPAGGQ
jgi:mono/diheme cytochrome c family protein